MIDKQLLDRFVEGRDPSAFRELVARHGPAVLRVCRGFLHDVHEAEDAMQATFLILVQRAPSIREPELLNRWLVGVARKVAARARRRGAIRGERERRWAEMHPEARETDSPLFDVRRVVREEMDQLPEQSRLPLSLCYLEGLTHEQAAQRLGWPIGTVKVRLVRGRQKLRERLDRRGVALSVAFLLMLLRRGASASESATSFDSTVRVMSLAASGDLASIQLEFPRAFGLAGTLQQFGVPVAMASKIFLALAILLSSSGGVALAHRIKASNDDRTASFARLIKVLEADCK